MCAKTRKTRSMIDKYLIGLTYFLQCACLGNPQLLINVQNQGGEVVQETITSNIGDDVIILEFQRTDGTLITQLIDFRSEVQILKALVLGEEERGQNTYQVMCFVTRFMKSEFISSDAMAKLRQKNPHTVRTPEEDRGKENFTMTGWIHLDKSSPISRHISYLCSEAQDSTYVRDVDIKAWSELPGASISNLLSAVQSFPIFVANIDTPSVINNNNHIKPIANSISNNNNHRGTIPPAIAAQLHLNAKSTMSPHNSRQHEQTETQSSTSKCNEVSAIWAPCMCSLEMCIGWYPCGLKYCKGKQQPSSDSVNAINGSASNSYRCGIKTCRKCFHYVYYVRQKQQCLWDE
ncbi:out at first protein [Culicoides brevitarsis]|uniref:out at first protein n=1 Tax=Culicoides brevitarsis TaxID=469753 RepID=UPI00307C9CD9